MVLLENILLQFLPEVVDSTIIDGGHYLVKEDAPGHHTHCLNLESTLTFEVAVKLCAEGRKQGKKVDVSFLVADLAVSKERRQEFNQLFQLPQEYLDILEQNSLPASEVKLFYESRLRNRARRTIKDSLEKGLIVEWGNAYRLNLDIYGIFDDDQVSNETINRPARVPNCRMIIGQELADKEKMGYKKAINFCNQDAFKCAGRFAAVYQTLLEGKMEVLNFLLIKNESGAIETNVQIYVPQKSTARILLVEDRYYPILLVRRAIQNNITQYFPNFSDEDYTHTRNFHEAKRLVQENRYDIIFLDHHLPMDEPELDEIGDVTEKALEACKDIGYYLVGDIKRKSPSTLVVGISQVEKYRYEGVPQMPDYIVDKSKLEQELGAILNQVFRKIPRSGGR